MTNVTILLLMEPITRLLGMEIFLKFFKKVVFVLVLCFANSIWNCIFASIPIKLDCATLFISRWIRIELQFILIHMNTLWHKESLKRLSKKLKLWLKKSLLALLVKTSTIITLATNKTLLSNHLLNNNGEGFDKMLKNEKLYQAMDKFVWPSILLISRT